MRGSLESKHHDSPQTETPRSLRYTTGPPEKAHLSLSIIYSLYFWSRNWQKLRRSKRRPFSHEARRLGAFFQWIPPDPVGRCIVGPGREDFGERQSLPDGQLLKNGRSRLTMRGMCGMEVYTLLQGFEI